MDKHLWEETISEQVDPRSRHKTLVLMQHQLTSAEKPKLKWFLFALPLAPALASLFFIFRNQPEDLSDADLAQLMTERESEEIEIIGQLDLLDDLDVLEQWSPSDES